MADTAHLVFELKDLVVDTIRSVKMLDVNKKMNQVQIEYFHKRLSDISNELEIYETSFLIQNEPNLQSARAKLYKTQCMDGLSSLKATLQGIETSNKGPFTQAFPTILKESLEWFEKQLGDLKEKLEKLLSVIIDLNHISRDSVETSTNEQDFFKVVNMVTTNPKHIVLNFDEVSGTPESKLKKAIFGSNSSGTVTAVARGMGGVGKTCALRGVGRHPDTLGRFPDGVFYISLGVESGKTELIRSIAEFVKRSGGYKKSKEVEVAKDLPQCVNLAAEWFRGRILLILIDDIWCKNGLDSSVPEVLTGLCTESQSCIAFTTRDINLRTDEKIMFGKRGPSDSEKMLLCSAGLTSAPEDENEISAMESVLDITYGVPIALSVMGGRARFMVEEDGIEPNRIWSTVFKEYDDSKSILSGLAFRDVQNEKVMNVLLLSLDMIDKATTEKTSRHLFPELCILRKRQMVPFDVVERIWDLSAKEAEIHIALFRRFNMIELSSLQVNNQKKRSIQLHDFFIDLARQLAERQPGLMEKVAKRILLSYLGENNEGTIEQSFGSLKAGPSSAAQKEKKSFISQALTFFRGCEWKKPNKVAMKFHESWISLEDDGYSLHNLFRLLDMANMNEEGIALLSDPRWIAKQMDVCGWKQVDNAFGQVLTYLEEIALNTKRGRRSSESKCEKMQTFLSMVRAAVAESERHVAGSCEQGMLTTQLFGRLYHYRSCKHVRAFLEKIEASTSKVWMRSQEAFPAPVYSLGKVLAIRGTHLVRYGESGVEILSFDSEENLYILSQYFSEDDNLVKTVKTWNFSSQFCTEGACGGIGLSKDSKTFVVAAGPKLLVFQDCKSEGVRSNDVVVVSMDEFYISSVAISCDGRSVVTGSKKGNLVLWKITDGTWEGSLIGTHEAQVSTIAISNSGGHIASGSHDRTAVIWRQECSSWNRTVLKHVGAVLCCAISRCGKVVVTGDGDGKVRVWRKDRSGWEEKVLEEKAYVTSVAISDDNNVIVFGSYETIIVFEWKGAQWTRDVLRGHLEEVTTVAIGGDNQHVLSGSIWDDTVRISEVRATQWKTSHIRDQSLLLPVVAAGASRVMVGSIDGNVSVWKTRDGEWTSAPAFRVGGLVRKILLDEARLRVCVKIEKPEARLDDLKSEYFIEVNGKWAEDNSPEKSDVVWTASVPLKTDDWPLGLASMWPDWKKMYEIPGGDCFAVSLAYSPYFQIISIVNRP